MTLFGFLQFSFFAFPLVLIILNTNFRQRDTMHRKEITVFLQTILHISNFQISAWRFGKKIKNVWYFLTLPQLLFSTATSLKKKYTYDPISYEDTKFGSICETEKTDKIWRLTKQFALQRALLYMVAVCYIMKLFWFKSWPIIILNFLLWLTIISYCLPPISILKPSPFHPQDNQHDTIISFLYPVQQNWKSMFI